ncbi:LacI family DNA-binding transcriptional regulator [Acetobacter musti]|nr:LacI family DNA-binding transcriptional regulator [Acetobacter musti]
MADMEDAEDLSRQGRVTIADIARDVGLNPSTVSRALSNPDRVSPETRRLVSQAAVRMGYVMNQMARSLRTGRTSTILVTAPAPSDRSISPVVMDVLRGIFSEARRMDYGVLVRETESGAATLRRTPVSGVADGIISISGTEVLMRAGGVAPDLAGVPVISLLTDQTRHGIPSIVADEEAGFREIAEYLLSRGHRRFAYVQGPGEASEHDRPRLRGLCDRLARETPEIRPVVLLAGDFDFASGARAAGEFLALDTLPTAVACVCDFVAQGFIHRVMEAGLRVPDDVAVVGYDDVDFSGWTTPGLTTVSQPTVKIGEAGARMLIDACLGRFELTAQRVIMPVSLIRRHSA